MDIGLNDPEDFEALRRILDVSQSIQELRGQLPQTVHDLSPEGSDIATLLADIPDPPVDPRLSIQAGLNSAAGCFLQIVRFITDGIPTEPVVLATLARTALLSASRIVFVLGPEDAADRCTNAAAMMRQEADSLMRLYNAAEKFVVLKALVPPQEVLDPQRVRAQAVRNEAEKLTETAALEKAAAVFAQILSAHPSYSDDMATQLREHLAWTFNVYSGVAHGFAWPQLVPRTESLPGHFLVELTTVANITHMAFDLAARRSKAPS